MAASSIQDRTSEFQSILRQAQRKQTLSSSSSTSGTSKALSAQRQSLLTETQKAAANGHITEKTSKSAHRSQRTEFARRAAEIGRGIGATMAKLNRLAELAKRKTLFDDRPVEIAELTFVVKQDLAGLNAQISALQVLSKAQQQQQQQRGGAFGSKLSTAGGDQEGEHNKNVVVLLQGKLADVSVNFKEVLEVRTKNIQASRSRTENFVSSVSSSTNAAAQHPQQPSTAISTARTDSPLYQQQTTPLRGRSPKPGTKAGGGGGGGGGADILSLDPDSSGGTSALAGPASDRQLLLMEEAQPAANTYIQQRGEAIEAIERTIGELGGIFGQLAQMVSEQSEMIQRIDANTEDVVDNVEGAQRELMKYWNRMSGNRWLVAKMFGVLMIFFLLWVLVAG